MLQTAYISETGPKTCCRQPASVKQGQIHVADSLHQSTGPRIYCRQPTSEHRAKDMLQTANIREVGPKSCWRHRQPTSETQGHVADRMHQRNRAKNVLHTAYIREIGPKTLQTAYISETGPKTRCIQTTSVKQDQRQVADSLHQ